MDINLNQFVGSFLPHEISDKFNTLDGSDIAAWLESNDYQVSTFYNTGRNGLAITDKGISVSSNGYVSGQFIKD